MSCSHEKAEDYQVHYFLWLISERLRVKCRQLPFLMLWAGCLAPASLQHRECVFRGKKRLISHQAASSQLAASWETLGVWRVFSVPQIPKMHRGYPGGGTVASSVAPVPFPTPQKGYITPPQSLNSYPLWLWIAHFIPPEFSALLRPGFSTVKKHSSAPHVYCIQQKVIFTKIFFSCTIDWNRIDMHTRQEIFLFQEISIYEINTKHTSNVPYLRLWWLCQIPPVPQSRENLKILF